MDANTCKHETREVINVVTQPTRSSVVSVSQENGA